MGSSRGKGGRHFYGAVVGRKMPDRVVACSGEV